MKIAVYTSCSLNYLPKARVLADSLARNSPGATLTLCLNDEPPPDMDLAAEPFERIWQPVDLNYDRAWVFKHNVMELCTAVKGRALLRLMREEPDADLLLYLDPDTYVFNALDLIAPMMETAEIGLVPHILVPEDTDIGVRLTEMSVTEHGIYNLGHLVIRHGENARAFAEWWAARLDEYCYDERERGLFTDQRWADLVPAIFDGVRILKAPTLDVASWNLFGRDIEQAEAGDERSFTVNGDPLITYHFSGTGPTGTHKWVREIFDPGNGAAAEIERIYEAAIAACGQAQLEHAPPAFDFLDDGTPVTATARKLYRRHPDLQRAFPDPYATAGRPCFRDWLREKRPLTIDGLRLAPHRIERAFEELFDADWYLATYPEVAEAIGQNRFTDACDHYVRLGSRLFFDPNPFFVSAWYHEHASWHDRFGLRRNVGRREGTLLWHYLETGLPNRLEPIEYFDSGWYLNANQDVMDAFRSGRISCPLAHFLHHGSAEGRLPGPRFVAPPPPAEEAQTTEDAEASACRGPFGLFVAQGGVAGRVTA